MNQYKNEYAVEHISMRDDGALISADSGVGDRRASALPHRNAPPATGVKSPGGLRSVAEDQPGGVSGPHGPGEVDRVSAAVLVDVLADQHRGV